MNIQSSLINLPKNIINKKIKRDKIKEIIGNYKINLNHKFEAKKLDINDDKKISNMKYKKIFCNNSRENEKEKGNTNTNLLMNNHCRLQKPAEHVHTHNAIIKTEQYDN